jgi:undecaprenyl diphosphate synthase
MRHSGYFLYQAEYSEYYFTKTLWPDFEETELETAILGFAGTQRNFGK